MKRLKALTALTLTLILLSSPVSALTYTEQNLGTDGSGYDFILITYSDGTQEIETRPTVISNVPSGFDDYIPDEPDTQITGYYKYCKPCAKPEMQRLIGLSYSRITDAKSARERMVTFKVPVWQIGKNGQKVTKYMSLTVMQHIADDVKEIFNEIYNGPEKFPIHELGGYAWRSNGKDSFHSTGLAIDINPTWNPQFECKGGKPLVGSYYAPGTEPRSIGEDSDVVKAFLGHGWRWGREYSRPDYMHFDFSDFVDPSVEYNYDGF